MVSNRSKRAGFTLLELLVVFAVVTLVIAVTLPALEMAREAARRAECARNLKQLALAVHAYHQQANVLPAENMFLGPAMDLGWAWNASWAVPLLPSLEQTAALQRLQLFGECRFRGRGHGQHHGWLHDGARVLVSLGQSKGASGRAVGADQLCRQSRRSGCDPDVVGDHRRVLHGRAPGEPGRSRGNPVVERRYEPGFLRIRERHRRHRQHGTLQ